jgi:predicted Zn-dependent protease
VTRFLVSEALVAAARYDDAVDLLYGHVGTARDSPALRQLAAAAANADRRVVLSETLRALPPNLLDLPFYRRVQAALAIRSGDIQTAERDLRAYLDLHPRNLEVHLQLLQLLVRQKKIDRPARRGGTGCD